VADECGHNYRIVVFWEEIHFITDLEKKKYGMGILLNHLESDAQMIREKMQKSEDYYSNMEVLRIDIKQIHAKAGR